MPPQPGTSLFSQGGARQDPLPRLLASRGLRGVLSPAAALRPVDRGAPSAFRFPNRLLRPPLSQPKGQRRSLPSQRDPLSPGQLCQVPGNSGQKGSVGFRQKLHFLPITFIYATEKSVSGTVTKGISRCMWARWDGASEHGTVPGRAGPECPRPTPPTSAPAPHWGA